MKRIIIGEVLLTLFYLLIAFIGNGLSYFVIMTIPMTYILLALYMPNKKDL